MRVKVRMDDKQIIKNAKIFISHGGDARWDMLVFAHNEHQVEECRELANSMGFKQFVTKYTNRFSSVVETNLLPAKSSTQLNFEDFQKNSNISCKVKYSNSIYVDNNGHLYPCCYLGQIPYKYRDNIFNKEKAQLCPGNVCEIKDREPIQMVDGHQAMIAGLYVALLLALAPILQSATPQPRGLDSAGSPSSVSPAEEERCRVPEFAKKLGHEEKWKLHNGCM